MKNIITIGLPSKGRLKNDAISFFNDKGLKILQSNKERNYFATIEGKPNLKIIYLHAKEIIQRLGDGTLDLGISGLDLLNESEKNLQEKIALKKKLNFGNPNLVVAVPDDWIDVQTIADLEEVSFDIKRQALEFNIIPSFKTLKLLSLNVLPVDVMSTIISDEPING